jgi:ubiquinone/menaquinone biosynthesis C-methylase UbiE
MRIVEILGLFLLVLVIGNLWWRRTSRRRSLPCPSWLAWTLESPLMDRLIGTQTTLDRMGLRPGLRVLEVGPGPGRLLIPAARRVLPGGEVVGLDIQPGMLERLKARAARAGVSNLTAILGDATQTNFPPESFDVIYFCTVLGEIPNREAALRQCFAALKPNGILSITEIFPDPHYQSRATVRRLAEAAGFRLQAVHGPWYFFTANFIKV